MPIRVKICGITNLSDAVAAVDAGADALGFVFYEPSPRNVSFVTAAEIAQQLPPFIARVGVFVNPDAETVRVAAAAAGLDTLQFHGDEEPEFCTQFGLKAIKAFRVRDREVLTGCVQYRNAAWLLDSYVAGKLGGSGETFNWHLAAEATKLSRMIILAGGLTAENVTQAVEQVQPYAVDVSSGVELSPGKKDHRLMRSFVRAAHLPFAGKT